MKEPSGIIRVYHERIQKVYVWIVIVLVVGGAGGSSCSFTTRNARKKDLHMDYQDRQKEVERIQKAIRQDWGGSSASLRQHVANKPEDLRRDIYALFWRTGTTTEEPAKRAAIVEFMLKQTREETSLLRGQLLKWLLDFGKGDFNEQAIQTLLSFSWTPEYSPEAIRLIGIAECKEAIPRLQAEIQNEPARIDLPAGYYATSTWAALLVLARFGEEESLARIIRQVEGEPDIIVKATILFWDLAYTRRPAAFDVLKKYLNSDKRLPAVKATVPGRLEACYAAAPFAKYVKGFPIQETDFSEQQVMQARVWVNSQKEWQFK